MTAIAAPAYRARQTEAEFQRAVTDAAVALGWDWVHFRQMSGNPSGFPDLILWRGKVVIFVELKTEHRNSRFGPRQAEWRDRFLAQGTPWFLWRPSDWELIEQVLREGA